MSRAGSRALRERLQLLQFKPGLDSPGKAALGSLALRSFGETKNRLPPLPESETLVRALESGGWTGTAALPPERGDGQRP